MQIYCLTNNGNGLSEQICDILHHTAQEVMATKERKCRISLPELNLRGEITTSYKCGMMGHIAGIVFQANLDWNEGSTKTEFIVRPTKNNDELLGGRWVRAPLFPVDATYN